VRESAPDFQPPLATTRKWQTVQARLEESLLPQGAYVAAASGGVRAKETSVNLRATERLATGLKKNLTG
jgi:hypothetical protein